MLVVVGSKNPVKVAAVKAAFSRVWEKVEVIGRSVPTGVSEMPMNDQACIEGARNRALAALNTHPAAQFGVGLEGGVNPEPIGLMLLGWVAICHRDGRESIACSAKIPLPNLIAQRILAGEELGPIMDEILREDHTAQKGGASGALSGGLVPRQAKFEMAVAYGLSPFISAHLYTN